MDGRTDGWTGGLDERMVVWLIGHGDGCGDECE